MQFSKAYAKTFVTNEECRALYGEAIQAHEKLHKGTGEGSDFMGWLRLPEVYDEAEVARIQKAADKIRKTSELLIVIGIGGSYLGAKAAIEMLRMPLSQEKPQILFAGHNISGPYLAALLELAETKDFSINVISKSGTTTEPAIAFRLFKNLMEKKYGVEGARERIFVTTDKERGALFSLAEEAGYERFVIPDDVGGRYSVLTAVGLLPIAVAGIDIFAMLEGAKEAQKTYSNPDPQQNDCYQYAIARNVLYRKGKTIEILANYDERLHYFGEWWKQLYGESEGKDGKGLFPATLDFSTDLHAVGQYVQDGRRDLLETVLYVESVPRDVEIPYMEGNGDGLAFLEGKTVSSINRQACLGTLLAHTDGGVPCLLITIEKLDAYHFGQMVYFFEKACAISGYLLGVNPFDQPGVEAYKKNMFALLGKPGYAEEGARLSKRLESF